MIVHVNVKLQFSDPGYIGLPYWPERNTLISIMQDVHPKFGEAKKQAAILASCEKRGISPQEFEQIKILADRPFYTDTGRREGEIVIPERVIQSFVNNASQESPKAIPRVASKGLTFVGIQVYDAGRAGRFLRTGMHEKDAGMFRRFVKMEESNKRTWSESAFISNFTATGVLDIDDEIIRPDELRKLFEYGGRLYGIGSARPQGYGRFRVAAWVVPESYGQSEGRQEEQDRGRSVVLVTA